MTRLFTGDTSTGDLTQWSRVVSSGDQARAKAKWLSDPPEYALMKDSAVTPVIVDGDAGYAMKFTLTAADSFPATGSPANGAQKAQISSYTPYVMPGDTRWTAFSIKFGAGFDAFPAGRTDGDFLMCGVEYHGLSDAGPSYPLPGGMTIGWGMPRWAGPMTAKTPGTPPGMWSLFVDKYQNGLDATNAGFLGREIVLNVPFQTDVWFDVKTEIHWSPSDTAGYIRCWINNVPQTMLNGTTKWTGRTTCGITAPGEKWFPMMGLYRSGSGSASFPWHDMTMWCANYRAAATESGL